MKKQNSQVIHMAEEETTKLQKKNRWSRTGKWLGSLLLLWLELITSVRIFLEMFPTNRRVDWTMLLVGALVISLWMLLVYAKPRWMPVLFLVTLLGIGGFLWERMAVGLARSFSVDRHGDKADQRLSSSDLFVVESAGDEFYRDLDLLYVSIGNLVRILYGS